MKKTFLNFVGFFVAVLVSINLFAYDFEVDGIYYNINSNGTSVSVTFKDSTYNSYSDTVTIPATVTYDGTTYNVTTIGIHAFSNCTGLTSIDIPNSVTTIGGYAFQNCTGLTTIDIPNSVKTIDYSTFHSCTGLTTIDIPNSVTAIYASAFQNCKGLKTIDIPNSVKTIGQYAFYSCTSLTTIDIPESVTIINSYVFSNCTGLTSIDIPNSVSVIDSYAFQNCTNLTDLTIGNSVNLIAIYAFQNCTGLKTIDIPNSVTLIAQGVFQGCTNLTDVTIGNSVTTIGYSAFRDCTSLTSIGIPNSVTTIHPSAFQGCTNLTDVTIGNSVTTIGYSAFQNCTSLTTIDIPDSVTTIGHSAFYNCTSLKTIDIPNSVDTIGVYAFRNCTSLDTVYCMAESAPTLGEDVFLGASQNMIVIVPCRKGAIYESADGWKDLNIKESCITYEEELTATICDNETYTFAGKELSVADVYYDIIQIDDKSDSVYILTLTVNPTYDTTIYDTIQIEGAGEDYDVTNIDSLQTIYGCDSVVTTITHYYYISGLEDIANENTISIYPNPAHDKVTIEGKGEVVITNSIGQVVKEIKDNNTYRTLNIKDFERGVYYIKVGEITQKLVIE